MDDTATDTATNQPEDLHSTLLAHRHGPASVRFFNWANQGKLKILDDGFIIDHSVTTGLRPDENLTTRFPMLTLTPIDEWKYPKYEGWDRLEGLEKLIGTPAVELVKEQIRNAENQQSLVRRT